uniref:Putative secreted protein n=1 Tax=Anopheles marajoara TaxID=58244 RepID=A0A2M4CCX3_9DIPT
MISSFLSPLPPPTLALSAMFCLLNCLICSNYSQYGTHLIAPSLSFSLFQTHTRHAVPRVKNVQLSRPVFINSKCC